MKRPVCYDVTRLLLRFLNATPNGIDRVDLALAAHFLAGTREATFGATATGLGTRLLDGWAAAEAVRGIFSHLGESGRDLEVDPIFHRVRDFLSGATIAAVPKAKRRPLPWVDPRMVANWIAHHGLPVARTPRARLPRHSVYLNVSQFPLWIAPSFEWLQHRPDVRAAFFVHDLLPIQLPEYFRAGEFERHSRRLDTFARYASAGIVSTRTVAADLKAHLAKLGRGDCPLFVARPPVADTFFTPRIIDPSLSRHPYFVFCSTLEPRKNHLMILAVWRALVDRMGPSAPKLVLVGTRGWHYAPIIDLIHRSPSLRSHVIEIGGLSTPGLKRLIDNAQAVLMPSFGEGYGLPVHEALTAGAPVLASDVLAFREIKAEGLELLSPLNGEAWLEAVAARTHARRPATVPQATPLRGTDYFEALESFLDAL